MCGCSLQKAEPDQLRRQTGLSAGMCGERQRQQQDLTRNPRNPRQVLPLLWMLMLLPLPLTELPARRN